MKILLINDNPVVTKLVTLSAQKTNDEVETIHSLDYMNGEKVDLMIVDDALYNDIFFDTIKDKISYKESLFICSRETETNTEFSSVIKKPFLPTDLVELFTNIDKKIKELPTKIDEEESIDFDDLEQMDDLNFEDIGEADEMSDDDFLLDNLDEDSAFEEDMALGENVLDGDEAQKVKDLLDEEYDIALDLEDEVDADISEDETIED